MLSLSNDGTKLTKVTFHVNAACGEDFSAARLRHAADGRPEHLTHCANGEHYLVDGRVANGRISGRILAL